MGESGKNGLYCSGRAEDGGGKARNHEMRLSDKNFGGNRGVLNRTQPAEGPLPLACRTPAVVSEEVREDDKEDRVACYQCVIWLANLSPNIFT